MSEHYIVRVFESELDLITHETLGHQELETGGNLFGLFSHGGGPTVFLATRPAGDVHKTATSMSLDPEVTRPLEELAWGRFGVQFIGMWHSHHWIGLMEPSSGDRERTRRYAERHHRPQYTEILANFVGTRGDRKSTAVQLTPFWYLDARQLTRAETVIQVLPGMSPLRRALGDVKVEPLLREALRPPERLPENAYRLAASRGTPSSPGLSGWRRFLPGQHAGDAPAEDFDEVADDRPEDTPPPEEKTPDEQDKASEPEGAGKQDGPAEQDGAGPAHPTLRPIPDLTEYIVNHVEPVTRRLGGKFEVELQPGGRDELFVIVSLKGGHARLMIRAGWDGDRAVATQCRVEDRRSYLDWPPGQGGRLTFELGEPLYWGIRQLERLY
ncbi:hypothetical protein [Spirillospora sp. CA-128828]|uniref:hypothetical protein n=1 Tax=Spirillospora sp. CA-128828 TaxID=3240033 RepID=UPI003D8A0D6D